MTRQHLLIISLLLAGCSDRSPDTSGYDPAATPRNFPLSKVVKDNRPVFRIDPGMPWRLEFGRGSGWHGLDTVKLDQDGCVVLHSLKSKWQTATFNLPAEAVEEVLESLASNCLLELEKAYHAEVVDGTQWVLLVRQQDQKKSVYFNNHFPDPIVRFAFQLDKILSASAGPNLRWATVPFAQARDHERELWDCIK